MKFYRTIKGEIENIGSPVKAAFWFVICNVIQKSMHFILVPIFTRMMTTFEYGQYNVFTSWELIFSAFAGLNLAGNSYNVGMIKNYDDQDRYTSCIQGLWWISTLTVAALVLLTHCFWEPVTGLSFSLLLAMFVQIFANSSVDLWTAKQKFNYKYKGVLVLTVSLVFLTIIVSVIWVYLYEKKAIAAVWSKVSVLLLLSLITGAINIFHGKEFYNKDYWVAALRFNVPLIAYYLSLTILAQSDRIMINTFSGSDKAGIYSVANSLAHILTILNVSINGAFVPWEYRKIKDRDCSDIPNVGVLLIVMIGVCNLILIGIAPEIIKIMTPKEYYSAIWVVPPIAVATFFAFTYQLFVNIEFYYEKKYHVMIASIGVAVLNIILNWFFIPRFGFIAAGYTTLVSYIAFTFIHYLIMKHVCKHVEEGERIYNAPMTGAICVGMIAGMFAFIGLYSVAGWIRYLCVFCVIIALFIFLIRNKSQIITIVK